MRSCGYSFTKANRDFIRPLYFPWKLVWMSGRTFNTTIAQINIMPAAMWYISRQPISSPINPLTTREARMPVNSPDKTIPTFLPLFSGRENWAAIGMNICGIIEQTPVRNEAISIKWKLCVRAIVNRENIRMVKLTRMIFLRWYKSPRGVINNNPAA